MNLYLIYANSTQEDNDFVIIKEGFSVIAACAGVFWALYHKMWSVLFVTLMFNIFMFLIILTIVPVDSLLPISKIVTILIFGFFATDLREFDLEWKDYQLQDIILASSELEAELKFLERANKVNYV